MKPAPLLLAAALCLAGGATLSADDLILAENGISRAPIILFADAPPLTREAAEELARCLEKVTGAAPELIIGAPDAIPDRAIWVGVQPAVRGLFPELDLDFAHPEEILIAANARHVLIAGRDRWDPDQLVVEGINEKIIGRQSEYGTVNAIHTFIQEQLGVRWLWPGELGEDYPTRPTLSLAPFATRFHPQIRSRGGTFNFSALSNKGYGRAHLWTRRQRLQLDSLTIGGGHGFGDWWERHHETHPEIFALQPDGSRNGHPSPRNAKLCQSNPKVWELWLEDVGESLAKDPNQTIFNGSPNDGWSSGHCVCESCRAWDHPDAEPRLMHWHHFREERPALSDRHVTFANHLAAKLKERYPDRDYRVMMLSYGHSRPAPIRARPAENVIMASVANFYGRTDLVDRGSTWGTTHRDQFAAWGKLSHHLMWRPNTGSPAGWQQGLPDLSVAQTIADLKFAAENHCLGLFIDSVWEHWATQGPQYYVMAQLVWNPGADAGAILDDYYRRAFGPAAADVRAYFEEIETARMAFVKSHGYESGVGAFPELYTEELLALLAGHLSQALKKTDGASGIFSERVAFVRSGLAYTRRLMEITRAMNGYWDAPDERVADTVREWWAAQEALCAEYPHAINWGPVRPNAPRMLGLHPDFPNPKARKKPSAKQPDDLDQN